MDSASCHNLLLVCPKAYLLVYVLTVGWMNSKIVTQQP